MFIADVFDVLLRDKVTGEIAATTTLQQANIEIQVQENEIRGGKGNQLLGVIHAQRDINISLTDAEFKYDWMARQLGQTIKTGAGVAWAMPKWFKATGTTDVKITLDEKPIEDTLVIYDVDGKLIPKADYTVTDKDVVFTGISDGAKIEVRSYQYATNAQTQTIEIDNKVFAKGVEIILETIEINGEEQPTAKIQYIFDSASPSGNFSINTASERNAQAQEFTLKVLKPKDSEVVGKVLRIPLSA